MTTDAQKARNARKRAKLKAHNREKNFLSEYFADDVEGSVFVKVACREEELWYSWKHEEIFELDWDPGVFSLEYPNHPFYMAWLTEVLSKFGPGSSSIVPGSFEVWVNCDHFIAESPTPQGYQLSESIAADLNSLVPESDDA